MADICVSAFSLFFMQSKSFLSCQRSLRKTSNCQKLFGMAKIPTDNHIRSMLDPVHPRHLQGCFNAAVAVLRDNGGLKAFQRLGERTLIALDGTEYFCSQKLGCPHCQTRKRANGKTEFYHAMLAATLVAPGHNMVLPLMPEFIVRPDGAEKQDCERNAAKRWLAAHAERVRELRPVFLGDERDGAFLPNLHHQSVVAPWTAEVDVYRSLRITALKGAVRGVRTLWTITKS